MSDVGIRPRPADKNNTCDLADTETAVIRNHEIENGGHCAGHGQNADAEVGCGRAAVELAEFIQRQHQCSNASRKWHRREFWGSWIALVGIVSLLLVLSDGKCDSSEIRPIATLRRVAGTLCCERLSSNNETLQGDDDGGMPTHICDILDEDLSPYEAGALVALEAVYWLQVLSSDSTNGGLHRREEAKRALPLALGITIVMILAIFSPATAVLLILPSMMSLAMTVFRLYDMWSIRKNKEQLCASCQANGGYMTNGELV